MCNIAIATTNTMAQFPVRLCSWEDLSFSDAEQLLEICSDTENLQAQLCSRLGGEETGKSDKQALIELDLFTYAILFCKKHAFSPEQLSAFFTILKSVHSMCISTPYDNFQDSFVYFRELLLRHSVQRPPFSTSLYSLTEVKAITDYVLSTYFKHFKLYKYAFTKRVQLNLKFHYSGEEEEGEEDGEEQESVREETAGPDTQEEEAEQGETAVEEREEEAVEGDKEEGETSSEQQRLRQIISSAITVHLHQLKVTTYPLARLFSDIIINTQVTVEQQMSEHEKKMTEKITQLETNISDSKSKKK